MQAAQALDTWVNAALGPFRHPWGVAAFTWLTGMGTGATGVAVLLAACGLLAAGRRGWLAAPLALSFVGAEATTWLVKVLVGRARPAFLAGVSAASPSFPSAHATVSLSLYGFLGLAVAAALPGQRRRVLWAAAAAVGLIGFSRLYLSLHYLSDVAAGYAVAAGWLWGCWRWAGARAARAAPTPIPAMPGARDG